METQTSRAGRAAAAAGVLMTAGVQGEWLLNPQRDDGTITNRWEFALLLVLSSVGFVLLTVAVQGLRRASLRRTKPSRAGAMLSLVGAGLLAVFGALVLCTGLASGSPLEASFFAFGLGLLLLWIGPTLWGLSLRREAPAPGVWQLLLLAGTSAFATLAIPLDPWHDITLTVMFLVWSVIGALLLRHQAEGTTAKAARQASTA